MLKQLVSNGDITVEQAELAGRVPMAQDLTAEADSGGHTDNRPAVTLMPTMLALRDRLQEQYDYPNRLRVGAAGGIADSRRSRRPRSRWGRAYIVTGRFGQPGVRRIRHVRRRSADARRGGTGRHDHGPGRRHVRDGRQTPGAEARHHVRDAGDEALRTLSGVRQHRGDPGGGAGDVGEDDLRATARRNLDADTCVFSGSAIRARSRVPKRTPNIKWPWSSAGTSASRHAGRTRAKRRARLDYQVWCGPAMGAFNEWTCGTYLERPENRRAALVAQNLLDGACVLQRAQIAGAGDADRRRGSRQS